MSSSVETVSQSRQDLPRQDLSWKVEGMDCGSCAGTIRTALERLPGVSDIKVSVTKETLSLALSGSETSAEAITARVKRLGFAPTLLASKAEPAVAKAPAHEHDVCGCSHDHHPAPQAAAEAHGHDHDHVAHDHTHAHHEPWRLRPRPFGAEGGVGRIATITITPPATMITAPMIMRRIMPRP